MNERTFRTLEFDKILEQIRTYATSGKTAAGISPEIISTDLNDISTMIDEVDDALTMLRYRHVELAGITDIKEHVKRAEIGSMLGVADLNAVKGLLYRKYTLSGIFEEFQADEAELPHIRSYIEMLPDIHYIYKKIQSCIDETGVLDHASENLLRIRRRMSTEEQRIRERLNQLIRGSNQKKLSDSIITMRNNRYVVPVKVEYRSDFNGIVHDMSSSGQTVYIEPMAVVQMTNNIQSMRDEEAAEVEKILYDLSARVAEVGDALNLTDDYLHHLDMVFTKAKYGRSIRGTKPKVTETGGIYLPGAFHPLIDPEVVVKNDIIMDEETKAVIITGPNTGGKTVTLKTVGLCQLLAQSGVPVPARDGSVLRIFNKVFSDIGDEQSIEQSLSTFSSHLTNTRDIINEADADSLILLDEVGAGTDPEEGAALAISIIEHLLMLKSTLIATTHYPALKSFSYTREDVMNASVEFDVNSLSPTYRLLMGIPGKSNAFEISNKLGLNASIIRRARSLAGRDSNEVNDMISALEKHTAKARDNEYETTEILRDASKLQQELSRYYNDFEDYKEKLNKAARESANRIVKNAEIQSDEIIKSLEEMKARGAEGIQQHEIIEQRKALQDNYHHESLKQAVEQKNKDIVKEGDEVDVLSYGQKGEVLSVEDDEAVVQMGIIKMKVPMDELKKRKKEKISAPVSRRIGKQVVKRSLDLRGERYEEALNRLDQYLDQVLLSSYSEVEIIHGKGTGALQKGVQQFLKKHKKVKSFRGGLPSEGGFGVTIVEMK
ncbi:endonuclease MutS2 [Corticicoccus populi]|uniref:Endonuclease MutS2 n=1 Tax=Corticicoccus populi TaxID=1812821 RepID=A0ABW5WT18_9STAP